MATDKYKTSRNRHSYGHDADIRWYNDLVIFHGSLEPKQPKGTSDIQIWRFGKMMPQSSKIGDDWECYLHSMYNTQVHIVWSKLNGRLSKEQRNTSFPLRRGRDLVKTHKAQDPGLEMAASEAMLMWPVRWRTKGSNEMNATCFSHRLMCILTCAKIDYTYHMYVYIYIYICV